MVASILAVPNVCLQCMKANAILTKLSFLKVIYTIDNVRNVSSLLKKIRDAIIWLVGVVISFAMYVESRGLLLIMEIMIKVEDWSLCLKVRQLQQTTTMKILVVTVDALMSVVENVVVAFWSFQSNFCSSYFSFLLCF